MKQVAAALVKAQRAFGPALKTSSNPHFKSKYADLSACIEAVIDGLNANGIALIQAQHESDSGVTVETIFVHESGETLSTGKLHVPAAKQDPQGYGSALTYARRYSLMAACGIAPEDDDGNSASRGASKAPAGSGAAAKQSAYDALTPDWQAYVDGLARDVMNLCDQSGAKAALQRIHDEAEQQAGWDSEVKLALWSKLPSNVRTKIDQLEKGKVAA